MRNRGAIMAANLTTVMAGLGLAEPGHDALYCCEGPSNIPAS
jgi:hypothetical protein